MPENYMELAGDPAEGVDLVRGGPPERVPLTRRLTPAELVIVMLIARGLKYPQIARRLGLSPFTVQVHVNNILPRIPGDLLGRSKIMAWWRGASYEVLTGSHLKQEDAAWIAATGNVLKEARNGTRR